MRKDLDAVGACNFDLGSSAGGLIKYIKHASAAVLTSCTALSAVASNDFRAHQVLGLPYAEARAVVSANQMKPIAQWPNPTTDRERSHLISEGFTEVEACAGSGLTPCSFLFEGEGGSRLRLVTLGEGGGKAKVAFYEYTTVDGLDGGEGARSAADYLAREDLRKSSPDYQPKAFAYENIKALAERLTSEYATQMSFLPKKADPASFNSKGPMMLMSGKVEHSTAIAYCAEESDEVVRYWGLYNSLLAQQEKLSAAGIFLGVSGRSSFDSFYKIYKRKLDARMINAALTDTQLAIISMAMELTHDHQLSIGEIYSVATFSCESAIKRAVSQNVVLASQ